jgi:creatinine amidohydrolase
VSAVTWEDLAEFAKGSKGVVLPVGSLEQHGPHLPLGTDTLIVETVAQRVAEETGWLVAPSVSYGYKPQPGSSGGNGFPGTCSLDGYTLILLVRDVVREFLRHRIKRIMILDGHYENSLFLNEAVDLAIRESGRGDAKVVVARWFDLVSPGFFKELFSDGFEGMAVEHASKVETSLVLAIDEDLVKKNRMRDDAPLRRENYVVLPEQAEFIPQSGVLTHVFPSSKELGQKLLQKIVEECVKILKKEFS